MNELSESHYPIDLNSDEYFMNEAIKEAKKALRNDEVPVGAVVVQDSSVDIRGWSRRYPGMESSISALIAPIARRMASDGVGRTEIKTTDRVQNEVEFT